MAYDKVVDADGHILEPQDLWENYLESSYRDRGIRWKVNDQGVEYIEIDGKPSRSQLSTGALGGVGGYPNADGDRTSLFDPHRTKYLDSAPPGSMDPHQRIQVLDQEGIDIALIYPTIGIIWEESVDDPGLASALCRAYNNWLFDFCQPYPDRLVAVAHVSLLDVEDAVLEMRRTAKRGARAFFIRPDKVGDKTLGHPDYDPIWAEAQDLGLPIAPHVVVRTQESPLRDWSRSIAGVMPNPRGAGVFGFTYLMLPVQAAFTAMMTTGVFERFPQLKYVILEAGAGWIAHWLDRMDSKYKIFKSFSPMTQKPSEYFARQCTISTEPDEQATPAMVELLGEDRFVWASDFPHIDADMGTVKELREHIGGMSETAQRKILGENAARLYSLA